MNSGKKKKKKLSYSFWAGPVGPTQLTSASPLSPREAHLANAPAPPPPGASACAPGPWSRAPIKGGRPFRARVP
jgi:hypothetical protein